MTTGKQNRRKLLFLEPKIEPYGGAICVAGWALQALKDDWDVTILTAQAPDFDGMNLRFGTRLQPGDFTVHKLPFPLSQVERLDPDPFSIQPHVFLMRYARKLAGKTDVMVSTCDEVDFGTPGIQYVHYPYMAKHVPALERADSMSRSEKFLGLLNGRFRPWMAISGISLAGIRRNRTLTNSSWTAARVEETYGIRADVIYPPVVWTGPDRCWSERTDSFVSLGRLSPEKRYLEIIDVLQSVRDRGHAVEYDIIGTPDLVAGRAYVEKIEQRISRTSGWVRLRKSISRAELEETVSRCRYGIHGMDGEHFGIAVAELVRAGCIVFVPDSGGQVEIVGEHACLRYRSDDDAIEKICGVLESPAEQSRLLDALKVRAGLFSEEHFMGAFRKAVADFAGH